LDGKVSHEIGKRANNRPKVLDRPISRIS